MPANIHLSVAVGVSLLGLLSVTSSAAPLSGELNATFVKAGPSLAPKEWQRSGGDWQVHTLRENLLGPEPVLTGRGGVYLWQKPVGDFSWTLRIRYDELRFARYLPVAGVTFGARDRKNGRQLILDRITGQLRLIEIHEGRKKELGVSPHGFLTKPGTWFWMKVEVTGGKLKSWLSPDGIAWTAMLEQSLPQESPPGELIGVVGGAQNATFDLAPQPWLHALRPHDARVGLTAAVATQRFRQDEPGRLAVGIELTWRAETTERQPLTLSLMTSQGDISTSWQPQRGQSTETVWVPLNAQAPHGPLQLELLQNGQALASKEATVDNPQAKALSPAPEIPTNLNQPLTPERLRSAIEQLDDAHRKQRTRPFRSSDWALAETWLWQQTKQPRWKDALLTRTRASLQNHQKNGWLPRSFHDLYPTALALETAAKLPEWTAEDQASLPGMFQQTLRQAAYERGPMNRSLGIALGTMPALRLAGDIPEAKTIQVIRDQVWADYATRWEPMEDSTNYSMLTALFASLYAEESGQDEVWQKPEWRRIFEQLLATLSPLGYVPAYGDDEDSHPGLLVGLFQLAASQWQDGRYQWAANRVFNTHFGPNADWAKLKSYDMVGLTLALRSFQPGIQPIAPKAGAQVLTSNAGVPRKLVLRGGPSPDDLYVLLDLLNGNEHGHHDALAVIAITAQNQALIRDNGRYALGRTFHNVSAMERPDDAMTAVEQSRRLRVRPFRSGQWRHYSLPLRHHWIWGNFEGDIGLPSLEREQYHADIPLPYNPATESVIGWEFTSEGGGEKATLFLDDVRMTGPQGDYLVTDFATVSPTWLNATDTQLVKDATRGKVVGKTAVPLTPNSSYVGLKLPVPLDVREGPYDRLEFWMRVDDAPSQRAFVKSFLVGDQDGYPKRFLSINTPAEAVTVPYLQEIPGGAMARLEAKWLDARGQPQRYQRDLLCLYEHGLWIVDTFDPAPSGEAVAVMNWHLSAAKLRDANTAELAPGIGLTLAAEPTAKAELQRRDLYGVENPLLFQIASPGQAGAHRLSAVLSLQGASSPGDATQITWGSHTWKAQPNAQGAPFVASPLPSQASSP